MYCRYTDDSLTTDDWICDLQDDILCLILYASRLGNVALS